MRHEVALASGKANNDRNVTHVTAAHRPRD